MRLGLFPPEARCRPPDSSADDKDSKWRGECPFEMRPNDPPHASRTKSSNKSSIVGGFVVTGSDHPRYAAHGRTAAIALSVGCRSVGADQEIALGRDEHQLVGHAHP